MTSYYDRISDKIATEKKPRIKKALIKKATE